jgi:hypothetical protein
MVNIGGKRAKIHGEEEKLGEKRETIPPARMLAELKLSAIMV